MNPGVLRVCMATNRIKTLQQLTNGLEECQKSLSGYLDGKRHVFPRYNLRIENTFHALTNDDERERKEKQIEKQKRKQQQQQQK